jgi:hypothetical protein
VPESKDDTVSAIASSVSYPANFLAL